MKSRLLSEVGGIAHAFGTLHESLPEPFREGFIFPRWRQNHGTQSVRVDTAGQDCKEADALYSFRHGLPVAVVTADCVPILMARRSGDGVAAVHAGWRGTRARILKILWENLMYEGERPEEWVAAIGPAIGPCCYEVSEVLSDDFAQQFSEWDPGIVVPRKRHLDLPGINEAELKSIGLHQVEVLRACTRCSSDPVFHSFRREGGGTRQWSVIMRE